MKNTSKTSDPWGTANPLDPFTDTLHRNGWRHPSTDRKFAWLPVTSTMSNERIWFKHYYIKHGRTARFNKPGSSKPIVYFILTEEEYFLKKLSEKC